MQNRSVVTGKAKQASDGTPQPTDTALIREAQALQSECATFGIPLTASDALSHLLAVRAATKGTSMTSAQLARAAQIEQARLRTRGVFVSTSEALQRVMQTAVSL